jgi:carbon monoxide dehydrogenase subunit G
MHLTREEPASVLLEVTKVTVVGVTQAAAWALLRDVPRLSACIPKVSDLQVLEPDQRYAAVVSDRLGPFGLHVPVRIDVHEVEAPRRIAAALTGDDSRGQARVRGTLEAVAEAQGSDATELTLRVHLEILGKLATLGAMPIRRRADEIFSEFMQRVGRELAQGAPADDDTGRAA